MKALYCPGPSYFDASVKDAAGWWHILEVQRQALEKAGFEVTVAPPVAPVYEADPPIAKYFTYGMPHVDGAVDTDLILGAPSYTFLPFMASLIMQRAKTVGYVWNNASWWRRQQLEGEYKRFGAVYNEKPSGELLNTLSLKICNHVIACSPWVKKTHAAIVPPDRISIAFWGVDSQKFTPAATEPPGFRVLFVGGDPIRKGLGYLLDAFSDLVLGEQLDMELWIAGCNVKLSGATAPVKLLGPVPHAAVPDVYRQCHVMVCPTLEDGIACLPPNQIVMGPVPTNIQDVKPGQLVYTHTGALRPVTRTLARHYEGKMIRLRVTGCNEDLEVTPEHRVLVRKRRSIRHQSPRHDVQLLKQLSWMAASDLTVGDEVVFPKPKSLDAWHPVYDLSKYKGFCEDSSWRVNKSRTSERRKFSRVRLPAKLGMTYELAEFLGWYVAEGNIEPGRIRLTLGAHEPENVQRILYLVQKVFRVVGGMDGPSHGCLHVYVFSETLADFVGSLCGKGSHNKHMPDGLLESRNLGYIRAFLRGYLGGDGHIQEAKEGRHAQVSGTTVSSVLAHQIRLAFLRCGEMSHILHISSSAGFDAYRISYREGVRKKGQGGQPERSHQQTWLHPSVGIALSRIRAVAQIDYCGPVYNLEVLGDQSYVMAQGSVHNCVIQESMASGLVPIASPDAAEVFEDGVSGIKVGFRDVDGIKNALRTLYQDPERRRTMAQAARALAETQTWQKTRRDFAEVIRRVMDGNGDLPFESATPWLKEGAVDPLG